MIGKCAFYNANQLVDVEFSDATNWLKYGTSNVDEEIGVDETSFEDNVAAAELLKENRSNYWKRG
jgi:hypothetical protein